MQCTRVQYERDDFWLYFMGISLMGCWHVDKHWNFPSFMLSALSLFSLTLFSLYGFSMLGYIIWEWPNMATLSKKRNPTLAPVFLIIHLYFKPNLSKLSVKHHTICIEASSLCKFFWNYIHVYATSEWPPILVTCKFGSLKEKHWEYYACTKPYISLHTEF